MTKREKKTKQIGYKQVVFHTPTETLKTLVDRALLKRKTVGKRKQNISADIDSPEWIVLGEVRSDPKGFTFGALMSYTPGTHPLFLIEDDGAEDVTLEQYATPADDDGKRRELLDSVLFFGINGNHVVVMQSSALRTSKLESYLSWLLDSAKVWTGVNSLRLVDKPNKEIRDKFEKNPSIRAIKVGTDLTAPAEASETEIEESSSFSNAVSLDVLKGLLEPAKFAKLPLKDLADANIEMTLLLRYRRTTTKKGQKLMNQLGSAFRNTDDVDLEIELNGGGRIKGSELKLTGPVRVTSYDGQLSAYEVYAAMQTWFREKIESQDIRA